MPLQSRTVAFGDTSVMLRFADGQGAAIVDFLYRRIVHADAAAPHITFHVVPGVEPGELSLYRQGRLLYDGDVPGQLANQLMSDTLYNLADKSRAGMVIHAAAACRGGRTLLMPGTTGAGKSSLSVWLMQNGFEYLTDELVYIGAGADTIRGFMRPLNIKARAREAVSRRFDLDANPDAVLVCPQAMLLSPEQVGAVAASDTQTLGAILFPRYESDARLSIRRLSPAQAGLRLMSCLINARNLDAHGFPEATRIARRVPAHELVYGSYDQLDAALGDLQGMLLESAA